MLGDKAAPRRCMERCSEHPERSSLTPYYALDCWACFGRNRYCDVCDGVGRLPFSTCPDHLSSPDVELAVRCYRWVERGQLPVPGAVLDQAQTFLRVVEFIERVWTHFDNKRFDERVKGQR